MELFNPYYRGKKYPDNHIHEFVEKKTFKTRLEMVEAVIMGEQTPYNTKCIHCNF